MLITLDDAKTYLRVDSSYDTSLILNLISTSEKEVMDVARLSADEWLNICEARDNSVTIRGEEHPSSEITMIRDLLRGAVYFALGYLYEHRESADHHELVMTLRHYLSSIREGVV